MIGMPDPFDLASSQLVITRLQEFTDNIRGTEPPGDEPMVPLYVAESTWQILESLAEQFGTHIENVVRAMAEDVVLAYGALGDADEGTAS